MHTIIKANTVPHKQWEVHKTINQQEQNPRLSMDSGLSLGGGA